MLGELLAVYERLGGTISRALRGPRTAASAALVAILVGSVVGAAAGDPASDARAGVGPAIAAAPPPPAPAVSTPTPTAPALPAPVAPAPTVAPAPEPAPVDAPAPVVLDVGEPLPTAPVPAADDTPTEDDEDVSGESDGDAAPSDDAQDEPLARPDLPAIRHVTVVWMADGRSERTFAPDSPMPYLAGTLAAEGLLLPRYHAVAHGQVANGVALLGGLGPTAQQQSGCAVPTPVRPARGGDDGQILGDGCVLPAEVPNLLGQLTGAGRSWKVYAGDLSATGVDSCRAPVPGEPDPASGAPRPGDAFLSARVPALWFAGLTAGSDCGGIVDLQQLDRDLAEPDRLPDLSLVVPHACDAGGEVVCPDGRPSGPAAADAFLRDLVPRLTAAPRFDREGLVVIVWDQAPQEGPFADARACCSSRPPFANVTNPGGPLLQGPGGGRTGALLLSPFVEPGVVLQKPYDHFSLLRSLQDIFELDRLGYAARRGVEGFGPRVFARRGE